MAVPISKDVLLYTEILGIPRVECPPNHYRLIGLPVFESNTSVIQEAVNQTLLTIKHGNHGKYGDAMEKEVQKAAGLLLNPGLKEAYDGILSQAVQQKSVSSPPPSNSAGSHAPAPLSYQAPRAAAPFPGQSSPPSGPPPVSRASYPPAPTAETYSRPTRPAATTSSKPRRKIKSGKRPPGPVAIAVRMVLVFLIIAAHVALYWFVYDYMQRQRETASPSEVAKSTPEEQEQNPVYGKPVSQDQPPVPPPSSSGLPATEPDSLVSDDETPVTPQPMPPTGAPPSNDSMSNDLSADGMKPDPTSSNLLFPEEDPPAEEIPTGPFALVESKAELPAFTPEFFEPTSAVSLGLVDPPAQPNTQLSLDATAVNLGLELSLDLVQTVSVEKGQRTWDVVKTDSLGQAIAQLGHFYLEESGDLRFHWNEEASPDEAEQLRNAILVCSHEDQTKNMTLRRAEQMSAIDIALDGTEMMESLLIKSPPRPDTICLEAKVVGTDFPVTAEPQTWICRLGEAVELSVGDTKYDTRAELRVLSKQESPSTTEISVLPKYRKEEKGRLESLTGSEMTQQITRLQRLLMDDANDLADAQKSLPEHLKTLSKLNSTTPQNKDQAGAIARQRIHVQGYINKCRSTIKAKTRTIPTSYEALNHIIVASQIAKDLDANAMIGYEVFAETPSGRIPLIRGKSIPSPLSRSDAFNFLANLPGVAGTWFAISPEVRVVELSQGGSVTIKDASSTRTLGSGSWRKDGDYVEITALGRTDKYLFHNGVGLQGSNGNALFRKF